MTMYRLQLGSLVMAIAFSVTGCSATPGSGGSAEPDKGKVRQSYDVIPVPTDGTWRPNPDDSTYVGFGEWSPEVLNKHFVYLIDSPPSITQVEDRLLMQSEVHIRRTAKDPSPLDYIVERASLIPGVSMIDGDGGLRYDEAYGDATVECPVEDIEVGDTTKCVIKYWEQLHPEWLQDSHWLLHGFYMGTWPSQTLP